MHKAVEVKHFNTINTNYMCITIWRIKKCTCICLCSHFLFNDTCTHSNWLWNEFL